jgi:hypothetical protein
MSIRLYMMGCIFIILLFAVEPTVNGGNTVQMATAQQGGDDKKDDDNGSSCPDKKTVAQKETSKVNDRLPRYEFNQGMLQY